MPKRYGREFLRSVCDRLVAGEKVSSLALELGVSEATVGLWKRQARRTGHNGHRVAAPLPGNRLRHARRDRREHRRVHVALGLAAAVSTIPLAQTARLPACLRSFGQEPRLRSRTSKARP